MQALQFHVIAPVTTPLKCRNCTHFESTGINGGGYCWAITTTWMDQVFPSAGNGDNERCADRFEEMPF